jgi:serpin B
MRNPVASLIAVLLLLISGPALAAAPTKDDMDLSPAAAANNAFALDLYAKLRGASGNIFLSPYSISTALAMTSAGARGQTEAEMIQTLHLSTLPPAQRHAILGALIQRYQADRAEKGYELHVADALWLAKGFSILPGFSNIAQTHYAAQTAEVDFHHSSEAAATINNWVSAHTNDKIKDLIPASALNDLTCLVLTNAVYFKGDWETPFQSRVTQDGTFHSPSGDKTVPMMRRQGQYGFFENDSLSALTLPYAGGDLEMLAMLPKKLDGINDLENSLDGAMLSDVSSKIRSREVIVTLPKFHMESRFDLSSVLKEMGMASAFKSGADFSGIDGKHDLLISGVVHKAYVDVDEKGTEAAGATGIIVGTMAMIGNPPEFNADHPFLFLIRDLKNQTILFMGRVSNPGQLRVSNYIEF